MQFSLKSTNKYPATVIVAGDESWLAELYKYFEKIENPLTAELHIEEKAFGKQFLVKGHLNFTPYYPCDRCGELQLLPLAAEVHVLFLSEDRYAGQKDVKLQRADLDSYLVKDASLDLGQVIIDSVHEALPSSFLPGEESGNHCPHCLAGQLN